ncbi:hypothetical protein ACTJJ4_17380 [Microbacterium sp. 22195]
MLDLIYLALTALVFVLIGLIAKGVESGPPAPEAPPGAKRRVERSRG